MKLEDNMDNFQDLCRACMLIIGSHSIFQSSKDCINNISEMMISITKTEVSENDGLPNKICETCLDSLVKAFKFKKMCMDSYVKMRDMLNCSIVEEVEVLIDENDINYEEEHLETDDYKNNICTEKEKFNENNNCLDEECEIIIEYEDECVDKCDSTDIDSNDKKIICIEEGSNITTEIEMIDEPREKSSGRFKCKVCEKEFVRKFNLQRHYINIHCSKNKSYECKICKMHFSDKGSLYQHRVRQHNGPPDIPLALKCEKCDREFENKKSLASHMKVHSDKKFTHSCCICDEENFTDLNLLKKHIQSHGNVSKLQCNLCDNEFKSVTKLINHLNQHNSSKPYKCNVCNRDFQTFTRLQKHLLSHTNKRPYLCTHCGKSFNNPSYIKIHQMRHSELKPFQCNKCGLKFTLKCDLKTHEATHLKLKRFSCDVCGSSFTQSYTLSVHKRIHTGERPYPCESCEKRFNSTDQLKRHIRTHTGEKPYSCEFCSRAFSQKGDLIKHTRLHVGEKTYKCQQCPKAFKFQSELKAHTAEHFKESQQ